VTTNPEKGVSQTLILGRGRSVNLDEAPRLTYPFSLHGDKFCLPGGTKFVRLDNRHTSTSHTSVYYRRTDQDLHPAADPLPWGSDLEGRSPCPPYGGPRRCGSGGGRSQLTERSEGGRRVSGGFPVDSARTHRSNRGDCR
jgi:hypothetical protein